MIKEEKFRRGTLFLAVSRLQRWADTNVTLAFENAQVIPPFSREETFLVHNLNISGAYQGHF